MIVWESPWWFLALPFLAIVLFWWECKKRQQALKFPVNNAWRVASSSPKKWLGWVPFILRALALTFIVLALARPLAGRAEGQRTSEGLDIMLVVDTSGSMQAMDFEINGERQDRLTVVKSVLRDFIGKRANDRMGMVVFGSEAFTQAPLTLDHNILLQVMDQMVIGMAGKATAIGDAIAVASKRLKDLPAKSKVMILLTDGANTHGRVEPMTAASAAAALGIKIYTIGVGSHDEVPFPVQGFFGTTLQYQKLDLDEKLLEDIAARTGAQSFLASDTATLQKIYNTIDRLEKTKVEVKDYRRFEERAEVFILWALVFLTLELLWRLTRWQRLDA